MNKTTVADKSIDDSPTPTGSVPKFQAREGAINGACWAKERSTKEGELFTAYDVKLDRSYKDANDEWQHSQALNIRGARDLKNLIVVANDLLTQIEKDQNQ
jgi:hypothetical protein